MEGERAMSKSYEELDFTDDFLFSKILYSNKQLTKELLELILGKKVQIKDPDIEEQKATKITAEGKGVRFDIFVEEENAVYDIEMQTTLGGNLPKRTRYYQGMIDLNLISEGKRYEELKQSAIIFICLKDPFGRGRCKYTFSTRCTEDKELELPDGSVKIFLNASGHTADCSAGLLEFLQYLSTGQANSKLTKEIQKNVEQARKHVEWKTEYMTLLERDKENFNKGLKQGMEQGMEQGDKNRLKIVVRNLYRAKFSVSEIAKMNEVSEDEIREVLEL